MQSSLKLKFNSSQSLTLVDVQTRVNTLRDSQKKRLLKSSRIQLDAQGKKISTGILGILGLLCHPQQ